MSIMYLYMTMYTKTLYGSTHVYMNQLTSGFTHFWNLQIPWQQKSPPEKKHPHDRKKIHPAMRKVFGTGQPLPPE